MKLVDQHNPILLQKCEPFNFDEPVMDPYELSDELQKIRAEGGGMGNLQTEGTEDYNQVFFNPTILSTDGEKTYMMEGCLSYPGLFVKVKRPTDIVMEWWTEEDTRCEEKFSGMTSRILQHEVDHLNGITFIKRAQRHHLEKARKDLKMQKRLRKRQNNTTISA